MPATASNPTTGENTWQHLAALGRGLLCAPLIGKVDLSGVIQQTLLEAHMAGNTFPADDPQQRRAWLTKAFQNNLNDTIDKATAQKRDVRLEVSIDVAPVRNQDPFANLIPADWSTPSERLAWQEEVVRLTSALLSLPENMRKAVELRYLQNFSVEAIAVAMSRSKGAVAGLLKRGLVRLREALKESGMEESPGARP